jgi:hypothetical protein
LADIWRNIGKIINVRFLKITVGNRGTIAITKRKQNMQIKTQDGTASVASAGVGGAGLGLGIAGTALGLLNGNGGNILGGLFGGGNNCNSLMSELAKEKAERFAEKTGAEIYNAMFSQYKELAQATTNIDKRVSALEVAGPLREQLVEQKIDCCCSKMSAGLAALQAVVDGITKTVVPITTVCPNPMPQYNSWTAPTTGA